MIEVMVFRLIWQHVRSKKNDDRNCQYCHRNSIANNSHVKFVFEMYLENQYYELLN